MRTRDRPTASMNKDADDRLTDDFIDALMEHWDGDLARVCASIDNALVMVLLQAYHGDIASVAKHIDHTRQGVVKALLDLAKRGEKLH